MKVSRTCVAHWFYWTISSSGLQHCTKLPGNDSTQTVNLGIKASHTINKSIVYKIKITYLCLSIHQSIIYPSTTSSIKSSGSCQLLHNLNPKTLKHWRATDYVQGDDAKDGDERHQHGPGIPQTAGLIWVDLSEKPSHVHWYIMDYNGK